MSVRTARLLLAALFLAFAIETLLLALHGRPVIDEGVFLTAGRLVHGGELAYRDFPSSQGPTLPYVYGAFTRLFGDTLGVGRMLSWLCCLASGAAVCALAGRFGGPLAAGLALALAMEAIPALWVSTTVRTQALATPLVLGAAVALARPARSDWGRAAAPSLLLWATGVRLTNGLALLAVLAWVGWTLRRTPARLLRVGAIVGVQAIVVFAPMLAAPRAALYHVLVAQLGRGGRTGVRELTLLDGLARQLGFPLQPEHGLLPIAALGLLAAGVLAVGLARGPRPSLVLPLRDARAALLALLGLAALVFAPHLALNRPFLTYFVTSSWLLIPAAAIALARLAAAPAPAAWIGRAAIGLALAAGLAVAAGRWDVFVGRGAASVAHLRAVGRELHALAGDDCTMVTFQTHLAWEAGCRPLPGLEYSLFSFFPRMSEREAEARGVLSPALLSRRVTELRPELVAVSRADARRLRAGRRDGPLAFLPGAGRGYALHSVVEVASGMRLPRQPETLRMEIYARRDLLGAAEPAPRNVLLVLVDTLRADHLGAYGYERDTSPAIDAFAAESVLFESARSQAPCTVPSVNSLLTARHPLRFQGQRRETLTMPLGIPPRFPSAAELFARAGYATAAVSASPVVRKTPTRHNREGGFDRGFGTFDETCLWKDAACVNRRAFALLDRIGEPFFLYLHYMDPHGPYRPPASHARRFAVGEPQAAFVARGDPKPLGRMLYANGPPVQLAESDRQHLIDLYDDEIAYFDGRFAALLDALEARGLAERTIVVLAADHGEDFLEHGDVEHCRNLYESALRTPLVLRIPGGPARRIAANVQNLDLVPTLADLLDLDTSGVAFDGRSLLPWIRGAGAAPEPALAAWNTWLSIVDGDHKLLVDPDSGRTELYDLARDPGETRDLAAQQGGQRDRLRALLDGELRERGIDRAAGLEAARELEQQLRALGYLE